MANTADYMRVGGVTPKLRFFRGIGAAVDRSLAQCGLPSEIELFPEAYVASRKVLRVRGCLQQREKVEDLGWQVFSQMKVPDYRVETVRQIARPMLLGQRISRYVSLSRLAYSTAKPAIVPTAHGIRVHFADRDDCSDADQQYHDWSRIMAVVNFVRTGTRPDWCPPRVGFMSTLAPCQEARESFGNTEFHLGQSTLWIDIPNTILAISAGAIEIDGHPVASGTGPGQPTGSAAPGLLELLKAMILPYLGEGRVNIDLAAEFMDCSRRTLQRRLAVEGCSFQELLSEVRMDYAATLLRRESMRITDVSVALGFEHASHFTRAFQRHMGMTPSSFRAA